MGMLRHLGDHEWSQQHLSHYVEGELRPRDRRRLERHALGCADCGRGMRAMRALVHALQGMDGAARAPSTIFDRIRQAGGPLSAPSA